MLEREQRLKQLRVELARSEENVRDIEDALAACREDLALAERERDAAQSRIQGAHRDHADLLGQLEASARARQESTLRRERLEEEAAEVTRESGLGAGCAGARARRAGSRPRDAATRSTRVAPAWRPSAKSVAKRCSRRARAGRRRSSRSRDLLIRIESRRSSESSMGVGLKRMADQRQPDPGAPAGELEEELAERR